MKEKQKLKNARGITLVALVVTIIVLVILAGVSINMVLGQNGIIIQAKEAKEKTLNAEIHEQEQMNEVVDYIKNNETNNENNKENDNSENNNNKVLISKDESYVGYYADIDEDGTVDGIIFADLAIGGSGQWGESDETFSYEAITGVKEYYISKTNYEGKFGIKDVLTAKDGDGEERFYVMTLEDFNTGTYYCWYDAAYDTGMSDFLTMTSTDFGTGKVNTEKMIEKWNNSGYGAQNDNADGYLDMWGEIQEEVNKGWFVPSKGEFSAFGYNLNITSNNYKDFELPTWCWSSSHNNNLIAHTALFDYGCMSSSYVWWSGSVRLAKTF